MSDDKNKGRNDIGDYAVMYQDWFKIIEMECRQKQWDGTWGQFYPYVFMEGKSGVATVLYDPSRDTIAMIEEFRIGALYDDNQWLIGIPTGGLDDGEDPLEGAKRECIEETGLTPDTMTHMLSYKLEPGFTTHVHHLFYGTVDLDAIEERVNGQDDEGEDIKIRLFKAPEVKLMLEKNKIVNGTAITALQHFFLYHYNKEPSDGTTND